MSRRRRIFAFSRPGVLHASGIVRAEAGRMIELELIGGAQTVTGSKHILRMSRATVLLDCGLFQGHQSSALTPSTSRS